MERLLVGKFLRFIVIAVLFLLVLNAPAHSVEYNFEGRTITIGYDHDLGVRYFSEPEQQAWLEQVEEIFNVNIEFSSRSGYGVSAFMEYMEPLMLAGETDSDIYVIQDMYVVPASVEGFLTPLDDYLDAMYWESLPDFIEPDDLKSLYDGRHYIFPREPIYTGSGDVLYWNKSMFEREGLPNLYDLYEAGEWTWEAFKDICIQTTKDTTGDGEIDQWGFGSNETILGRPTEFFKAAFISNDALPVRNIEGRITFTLDEPQALEVLEFWQDLVYEEKVVDPRGAMGQFIAGDLAMLQGRVWNMRNFSEQMEEDYGMVPYPMGPRTDKHYTVSTHTWFLGIPITVDEDPGALIELMSALWRTTDRWLEEGVTWDDLLQEDRDEVALWVRDRETLEIWEWVKTSTVFPDGFSPYWVPDFQEMIENILVDGVSPASAVDAIKSSTQKHLDDLFN